MRFLWLTLLSLIVIPLMAPAFGADWYDSNWLKARQITIDETDIDADLTNYPLYVNMTLVDIGTDSQADCDDFVFVDSTNVTKFDHEIEKCDATNNWAEFWVEVPTVTGASDTILYMYYDNAGATDQQNSQGTWNANYQMVLHLNGTFIDSTSSPITCTNSGTSAVTDEYVGDSKSWDNVDDSINCGSDAKLDAIFTGGGSISMWTYSTGIGEGGGFFATKGSGSAGWLFYNPDVNTLPSPYRFHIRATSNGAWTTTNDEIVSNTWKFVTVTYNSDSSANDPLIYVDGTSVSLIDDAVVSDPVEDTTENLCLGNIYNCATTRTHDGRIDDFRMVDEILSAQWIKADWECQRGAVDGNSCITVGSEGTESAGGAHSKSNSDIQAHEDSISRQMTYNRANDDTLAHSESVQASVISALNRTPEDVLAHSESVVAVVNDLNQVLSDTLANEDSVSALCTGTCGVAPTLNTIVLRVVKDPFEFMVFTNTTRMACIPSLEGGVIYNSDVGNLNICDGTNWILPDGSPT